MNESDDYACYGRCECELFGLIKIYYGVRQLSGQRAPTLGICRKRIERARPRVYVHMIMRNNDCV